jgi:hypothetical protein
MTVMLPLRLVSVLALVIWIGGALTIAGLVAPSAFTVLPSGDAARVVGETLRRFHFVGYGAGAALVASLVLAGLLGPRPHAFWWRLWIAGLMLVATLVSGLWVSGRVAALRQEAGASMASLEPADPRRIAFGRWHSLSTGLMALTMAGGFVLLYFETSDAS